MRRADHSLNFISEKLGRVSKESITIIKLRTREEMRVFVASKKYLD